MKLEAISAVLRPRSHPEAIDLGLALVRRHAAGIYRASLVFLLPLWGLLLALFPENPSLAVFLAWWLKPLQDRAILFYLSRALFGAPPSLREQTQAWPALLRRSALKALLGDRLNSSRSFTLPVTVLEHLPGNADQARQQVLRQHGGAAASGFMQLFLLLEMAAVLGLWFGLREFLPTETLDWLSQASTSLTEGIEPPLALQWSVAACYLAAVFLLEPFYVGGGFGLYLNSRTHLEGWDVELAFRQLGQRLRARRSGPPPLLLLALLLGLGAPSPLPAQSDAKQAAAQQIQEILAHPDFTPRVEKIRQWEPREAPRPAPPTQSNSPRSPLGDAIRHFLAHYGAALALSLAAILLAILSWRLYQLKRPGRSAAAPPPGPPTVLGLEVAPESLPSDVPAAATALCEQGDPAAAVRLLYRAALAWLGQQPGGSLRASDTEGDCLARAAALSDPAAYPFFRELTAAWLNTAYGQAPPASAALLALCQAWPFAARPVPPRLSKAHPAALVLALAAALATSACDGQWKETERTIGYRGAAQHHPWLAASRLLQAQGLTVLEQRGWTHLPSPDTVLVAPSEAIPSQAEARLALDWTKRGGHLLYLAAGGASTLNDFADEAAAAPERPESHPILTQLGLTLSRRPQPAPSNQALVAEETYRLELQDSLRLDSRGAKRAPAILAGSAAQAALLTLPWGRGRVTVLSDAHPLRNRWIGQADHAALLLALVAQGQPDAVAFLQAGRVSLWDLLKTHAWPVLLGAALLLLAWLWRALPRFGPIQIPPHREERRFATHLHEVGAFLWHHRLGDDLLAPSRRAVLAAARHRSLRPGEPAFLSLLAERSQLPQNRVERALIGPAARDAPLLTRQLADLQTLLRALTPP